MNVEKFRGIVGSNFFTVTFKKKDNTVRNMTGRCGVSKFVKGTGNPVDDGRVVMWETSGGRGGAAAYRSFYPDSIISFKVNGKVYDKEGNVIP